MKWEMNRKEILKKLKKKKNDFMRWDNAIHDDMIWTTEKLLECRTPAHFYYTAYEHK